MSQSVVHQPRVAWDGARAFVRAAHSPEYFGFAARLLDALGPDLYGALASTRQRLTAASVESSDDDRFTADVEASRWRVRLEELLRERPDLTSVVSELTATVAR